jgi:hypothetical protein
MDIFRRLNVQGTKLFAKGKNNLPAETFQWPGNTMTMFLLAPSEVPHS